MCIHTQKDILDFKSEMPERKQEWIFKRTHWAGTEDRGFLNSRIIYRDGYVGMVSNWCTLTDS